jgi:PRTRC genetic system ThiF family protein
MIVHYTANYLLNPPHKVTIDLVGLGGTGSQVLSGLARINESLVAIGHPGFFVRSWDPDLISDANVGRQLFSSADLGLNKAVVLTTRINRYFGYDWQAMAERYSGQKRSNILITCVDSAKARIQIGGYHEKPVDARDPQNQLYYWLDIGNLHKTGQTIIGTMIPIKQPKPAEKIETTSNLKTVLKKFPQLTKIKEENQGPSCSLAEALSKQDLFINSTLAQFGCNLLWKMFKEGMLRYHGCFVNLDSFIVNPIRIK